MSETEIVVVTELQMLVCENWCVTVFCSDTLNSASNDWQLTTVLCVLVCLRTEHEQCIVTHLMCLCLCFW